jgi:hypothetical protein
MRGGMKILSYGNEIGQDEDEIRNENSVIWE